MIVQFRSEQEKTEVLYGLRTLQQRSLADNDNNAKLWSGIRASVFEQAIACVEATPVATLNPTGDGV